MLSTDSHAGSDQLWDSVRLALTDEDTSLRKAGLACVARLANPETLEALSAELPGKVTGRKDFADAKLCVLAKEDLEQALLAALEVRYADPDSILDILRRSPDGVSAGTWARALDHPSSALVEIALQRLAASGDLAEEALEQLIRGPVTSLRAAAYRAGISLGLDYDGKEVEESLKTDSALPIFRESPDAVLVELYAVRDCERTKAEISYYVSNGHLAYRALALRHFDSFGTTVRADLDDGFASLRDRSRASLLAEFQASVLQNSPELTETAREALLASIEQKVRESFSYSESTDAFVRGRFEEGALLALSRYGEPADVKYAREYGTSDQHAVQLAASLLLCAFATVEDLERLLELAIDGPYDTKMNAAAVALTIQPKFGSVATTLMDSGQIGLIRVTLRSLLDDRSEEVRNAANDLLRSDNSDVREAALTYFAINSSMEQLHELLDEYVSNGYYYYNVVTWLDRLLYAPEPHGRALRTELFSWFHDLHVTRPQGAI